MDLVEAFYSEIIPIGLWVAMLGMGLSLTPKEIKGIFASPKALGLGLAGQLLLLPLLALALALLFAPSPAMAVGVMILAACPGGVTSNAYSFASRADVALSVSLTAVTSFITIVSLPLITYLSMNFFLEAGTVPALPVGEMMSTLAQLTVVPVVIGMLIRHFWDEKARKLIEGIRLGTLIFLILLVVAGTIASIDVLRQYFLQTAFLAVSLNLLAMGAGYGLGQVFRLNPPQSVSITFEIGVQNITLASLVSLSLLGNQEYFVVTLVYAVIMKITALSFMYYAKRRMLPAGEEAAAATNEAAMAQGRL